MHFCLLLLLRTKVGRLLAKQKKILRPTQDDTISVYPFYAKNPLHPRNSVGAPSPHREETHFLIKPTFYGLQLKKHKKLQNFFFLEKFYIFIIICWIFDRNIIFEQILPIRESCCQIFSLNIHLFKQRLCLHKIFFQFYIF